VEDLKQRATLEHTISEAFITECNNTFDENEVALEINRWVPVPRMEQENGPNLSFFSAFSSP